MSLLSSLTGSVLAWPTAIVAGIAAAALGVTVTVQHFEMRSLQASNSALHLAIEDPHTGWAAKLAQSETNNAGLKIQIADTNTKIKAQSDLSTATIAKLTKQVAAANAEAVTERNRIAAILVPPLQGLTRCDRYDEADKRLLEIISPST